MQTVQEAMAQKQPMKVKMTGVSNIWDNFEQTIKTLPKFIEFKNWKEDDDTNDIHTD